MTEFQILACLCDNISTFIALLVKHMNGRHSVIMYETS